MLRVKICGITRVEDALAAAELGASALGFIFVKSSPRAVSVAAARAIIARVPPLLECVGVFANTPPVEVREIVRECGLSCAQLHGAERLADYASLGTPAYKAVTLSDDPRATREITELVEAGARMLMIDRAKGETAATPASFFRRAAELVPSHVLILAGGLTCENVLTALDVARPAGIDVARGVEGRPGHKDPDKLARFFARVRQWQRLA
jgi:phosphoribosylanthranilate isomerase